MSIKFFRQSIAILVLLCLLNQSQSIIYPQNGGSCCDANTVSVFGQGKVSVNPDIATVNIGATVDGKTSQQASQGVAEKINQIKNILDSNNIKKEDIKTQSISIFPRYDYSDGKSTLVGQTAQQSLSAIVRNIDQNGGNLGALIDQLVAVNGIVFSGLTFDKADKSEAKKQARKLAFEDAKAKANDFASLAEAQLGKALTIVDSTSSSSTPIYYPSNALIAADRSVPTSVPVGSLDVTYSVSVKFGLR